MGGDLENKPIDSHTESSWQMNIFLTSLYHDTNAHSNSTVSAIQGLSFHKNFYKAGASTYGLIPFRFSTFS